MGLLDDLRAACGEDHVRPAGPADAVDGVQPRLVAAPGSVAAASAVLGAARQAGAKALVRGGGSKLGWGNPPTALDLVVSTTRLDRVLEHAAGDLVVAVQGGLPLARLQRELAPAGQMLALDPPEAEATVGGVVAAGASGPRRLRYGTARDLLIGITVVLPDGTVAKAGGKVVKNVAGYDLGKLFTGSLGTLGLVAEAIFRLHPLPAASSLVMVEVDVPEAVGAATKALSHSTLEPAAVELTWPAGRRQGRLAVLFEGIRPGVAARARTAAGLLGDHGRASVLEAGEAEAALAGLGRLPWTAGALGLKLAAVPTEVPGLLAAVWEAAGEHGMEADLAAHAATGVVRAGLRGGDHDAQTAAVTTLRGRLAGAGASVTVAQAPVEVKRRVDAWGAGGDALGLMRRVKERFDPAGLLSPGRFVGGI